MSGFIANIDLPEAQSELALPLKSGDQVIGILELQSKEMNAFSIEDISTLSILADQIGIAIQNALIYEQSQRALREANTAFLQASQQEWKGYTERVERAAYLQ
jgi:GAF domain-containing protein